MTTAGGEKNEKYNWCKYAVMWIRMHVKKFKQGTVVDDVKPASWRGFTASVWKVILQGDRSLGECFYILQHLLLIACVADSLNRRGLCDTSGSTTKDSFNCYPTSKTTRESKILVKTNLGGSYIL